MNKEYVIKLLANALQPNGNVRIEAEKPIKTLIQTNFREIISLFLQIMVDSTVQPEVRNICSIITKNSLYSKNQRIQKGYESNWLKSSAIYKQEIIKLLESNLTIKDKFVFQNLTKIFGSIIRIELTNNTQYDFFANFLEMFKFPEYSVGILETVSYACDQLLEETKYSFENRQDEKANIYKIGTFYLGNPQNDFFTSASTLKCILSSLEIYEEVFKTLAKRIEFLYRIFNFDRSQESITQLSLCIINKFVDIYSGIRADSELSIFLSIYISFLPDHENIPVEFLNFGQLLLN